MKIINSVFENHKVETEWTVLKKVATSAISPRTLSCGRILNHCILININHAVRLHIKLITTSKSALFLEQKAVSRSSYVRGTLLVRYRVACIMICKHICSTNELVFTHFNLLGWPCHGRITVLRISSSQTWISWLKIAIFASTLSCLMWHVYLFEHQVIYRRGIMKPINCSQTL